MTLSHDDRKARAEQIQRERRTKREAVDSRHPWLLPLAIVVALVIIALAIVVPSMLGVSFF
jgi:hypothetical protein